MADVCPTCGRPWPEVPLEREPTVERLRRWCLDNGHHITPDDAVHELVAAVIVDRSPATLGNWRSQGSNGLAWFRSGRTGRIRYRLTDLADYLEAQRRDE